MKKFTRRDILLCSSAALAGSLLPSRTLGALFDRSSAGSGPVDVRGKIFRQDAPDTPGKWSCEGHRYRKLENDRVMCGICPNRCLLSKGDRSICRSKVNIGGTLYSLAYGNPCAVHLDPVEKKPLYHFLPRSRAFSIATTGCNFRCLNCQNYEISQAKPHEVRWRQLFPKEAVAAARRSDSVSIAYTYSEPITFFEYMLATARLARQNDLKNLLISNGYINRRPLLDVIEVLDGANINLKSFSDDIYRKLNGGRLQPVLDTLKRLHEHRVHLEITTLVVPGYVDDAEMVRRMCDWLLIHLGPDHPLHFIRFFPKYKLDRLPPTPVAVLERFRQIALESGLRYVYVGNVPGHGGNHTYCHQCGRMIIERQGFFIASFHLDSGRCAFCQTPIPGVWEPPSPANSTTFEPQNARTEISDALPNRRC